MRACTKCGIEKPLDAYSPEPRCKDGRMRICKQCRADGVRNKRLADPAFAAHDNARRMEWHYKNYHQRKYGVSRAQYYALIARCGERCWLCHTEDCGRGDEWAVDHDHQTGAVRGILCHPCNMSLGHYEKLAERVGYDRIEAYREGRLDGQQSGEHLFPRQQRPLQPDQPLRREGGLSEGLEEPAR